MGQIAFLDDWYTHPLKVPLGILVLALANPKTEMIDAHPGSRTCRHWSLAFTDSPDNE